MLHVIFMILKIIGIALLVILALVICLLCCILWIPIRYKAHGSYYDKLTGMIKISWFLHLVSLKAWYDGESALCLRILGIPFYDTRRREGKTRNEKQHTSSQKTEDEKNDSNEIKDDEIKDENQLNSESKAEEKETLETEQIDTFSTEGEESETKTSPDENNSRKKHLIRDRIKAFFNNLKRIIENIKYTIRGICDKIKQIWEAFYYYRDIFQSDEMKVAFSLCKKQLYRIWKNFRPKRFKVYLHIGNEDPCVTGEIMAFYGMIYPFAGGQIEIVPEFQETVLEGDIKAKGRITLFVLITVLIRVYFDKNIRKLLQLLKKEDSHGR